MGHGSVKLTASAALVRVRMLRRRRRRTGVLKIPRLATLAVAAAAGMLELAPDIVVVVSWSSLLSTRRILVESHNVHHSLRVGLLVLLGDT